MQRLGIVLLAGCSSVAGMTGSPMPWLHGFTTSGVSDVLASNVGQRIQRHVRSDDIVALDGIEISSDVAPVAGDETILASYAPGIVVLDRDGQGIATGPG